MIIQRLGSALQKDMDYIDSFIQAAKENPGSLDEVWLATDYGYPPLDVCEKNAEILKKTKKKFLDANIRVSMQISNTLGHGDYNSSNDCSGLIYENSPAEHIVGQDGAAARYGFCFNGTHFTEYLLASCAQYAKVEPDILWLDDDLRATNHGSADFCCFCDHCLALFNEKHKTSFTREELVEQITVGEIGWRDKWMTFVEESLYRFTFQLVREFHKASPKTRFGYQHGSYGGYTHNSLDFLFDAIRDASGTAPLHRPGGGAYSDHNPNEMVFKSRQIRWQNAQAPAYVTDYIPEIENLPDVAFGKTAQGTCTESSLYLASGCTGLSYAMMMRDWEPMEWHKREFAAFAKHRAYWEKLIEYSRKTRDSGVSLYLPPCMWKKPAKDKNDFSWTQEYYFQGVELMRNAVPYAYDKAENPVYFLTDPIASLLGAEEVEEITRLPVVLGASALAILCDRGFSHLFDIKAIPCETFPFFEVFTDHPINRVTEGKKWAQGFFVQRGHYLVDKEGSCEVVSYYGTQSKNAVKATEGAYEYGIATAVTKTKNGGKWAVFGNNMFNVFISYDRRNQILSAIDYVSGNALRAILWERQQAVLLPRVEKATGKTACVSILNCTIEHTGEMTLMIRNPAGESFSFMSAETTAQALPRRKTGDDFFVTVPPIAPWTVGTVFSE